MPIPIALELPTVSGVLDEPLRSIVGPVEPAIQRLFYLRPCWSDTWVRRGRPLSGMACHRPGGGMTSPRIDRREHLSCIAIEGLPSLWGRRFRLSTPLEQHPPASDREQIRPVGQQNNQQRNR